MFIVLEGIDCCGKSTTARLLAKQLDAVLYKTPPDNIIKRRDEIDANASALEHYLFYLDGIKTASTAIWDLLSSGENVVCDRYWLTTYVYHKIMGVSVNINDFSNITLPDLTVLLLVSSDIQARRFLDRGMSIGDKRMANYQVDLAREYKHMLVKEDIPQLIINTDHNCPAEVVERIQIYLDAYI